MKNLWRGMLPLTIIFALIALTTASFQPVHAAKARVKATKKSTVGAPKSSTGYSSAKLSRGTNSIILNLFNLGNVKKVSYSLEYTTNGREQGASGAVIPNGQTTESRDLYLGTCSKGACTAHYNIKNATLTVTVQTNTNLKNTKRYRVKI